MSEVVAKFDDKEVQRFFEEIINNQRSVKNRESDYLAAISIPVFKNILKHFDEKKGSKGKWPAWNKIYAESQLKRGRSERNMLQDTGNLWKKFLPGNIGPQSVEKFGTGIMWYNPAKTSKDFPYAKAHNEGGPKLPQREFMWIDDKVLDHIGQITLGFMLKGA